MLLVKKREKDDFVEEIIKKLQLFFLMNNGKSIRFLTFELSVTREPVKISLFTTFWFSLETTTGFNSDIGLVIYCWS